MICGYRCLLGSAVLILMTFDVLAAPAISHSLGVYFGPSGTDGWSAPSIAGVSGGFSGIKHIGHHDPWLDGIIVNASYMQYLNSGQQFKPNPVMEPKKNLEPYREFSRASPSRYQGGLGLYDAPHPELAGGYWHYWGPEKPRPPRDAVPQFCNRYMRGQGFPQNCCCK